MANFPTFNALPLSIEDSIALGAGRYKVEGLGPTGYFDPPDNPVPLARAPAGIISGDDGARQPKATPALRLLGFNNSATSTPEPGTALIPDTFIREVNRRAVPTTRLNYAGLRTDNLPGRLAISIGGEWFERLHITPPRIDLGNVLSSQLRTVELFNAFRNTPRVNLEWTGFANNAGDGITVTNLPVLPFTINSFASFVADIQISTVGPPNINGTLDFTFGAPVNGTIQVPVTGNRITVFQFRPQAPVAESLEFKTDILQSNDGTEQRIRVREAPRQVIDFVVRTDDDRDRDLINSILFDWQARVFGVPIWWEQRPLDADIAISSFTINVDTTNADFRVDSLVMVYTSNNYVEVLEIASLTATDITTKTPFGKAFAAADSIVTPVRTALTKPQLSNNRFAIGPADYQMNFEILDNVDLANIGAFATYQGTGQTVAKPLLDTFNFMPGNTIQEGNKQRVIRLDIQTNPPTQYSPWAKGKPLYTFGYEATSQADAWAWRQLMHYLRGSQLSFYVPTGRYEFRVLTDLGLGSSIMDITNIGFTDFVKQVTPRSDFRFLRTDGTYSNHQIISSEVISADVERITFAPNLPADLPVAEIERVEYLTLSRIDADKVKFEHRRPGESRLSFNLVGVPA